MTTNPLRILTAAGLAAAGAALAACNSRPFVPPPPTVASVADQLKTAENYARQAQTAEREKKPDEAIELYKKAVATYRDFPGVWYNLGLLLLDKGENLAAVDAFRTAGDLEPRDPRPPYAIGATYEKQGWHTEAQRHYTDALARDANFIPALQRSVYIDMNSGSFTAATLERTRRALLVERDPKWRDYFERTQIRLTSLLNQPASETGPITAPDDTPYGRHR